MSKLTDDCRWIRHRRPGLRSSSKMMILEVASTRITFGDRSFAVDGSAVFRRQFATQHYQLLSFLINSRLICSFNSCGVCDSEQTPMQMF